LRVVGSRFFLLAYRAHLATFDHLSVEEAFLERAEVVDHEHAL
jgi:hypothetical protein